MIACAAAVIAGMVMFADRSQERADRARRAQVLMEDLRSQAVRVDLLTWRTIGTRDEGSGRPPRKVVADGMALYRTVNGTLRELRRLGVPRAAMRDTETRIAAAYGIGIQALALSRANGNASRRLAAKSFAPAMAAVDLAIVRAAHRQGEEAQDALQSARTALIGSMLAGILLLGLLAWRVHRSERRSALAEQARAAERVGEQRLHALVRHSSDVVAVIDASGTIRWLAESVKPMLGYERDALLGTPLAELVHPEAAHRVVRFLDHAAVQNGRVGMLNVRLRQADGDFRALEMLADNRLADPLIEGILLNLRDVSERVALEEQLRHQAFHDSLTGLANRALFEDRLMQALVRAARHGGRPAVMFVDLDDFKTVNDSLGHAAGDALLQETAHRLTDIVRGVDTVARLGGDEFGILLEELDLDREALEIAERLCAAIAEPLQVAGRDLRTSASIGVAWAGEGSTAEELLRNADVAMYVAKDRGKDQVAGFEPEMHAQVVDRLELSGELAAAIEAGELALQYQPIVDLRTGEIADVEALVRWDHPTRGRLAPDRFIAIAEASGLIVPLGDWVLRAACTQMREWRERMPAMATLGLAVNVSTRQIAQPGFADGVRAIIDEVGLAPGQLTLEITEHLLVDDSKAMVRRLQALETAGVRLAVDDFGTGYSALSYLQAFPISVLKIDRSFVSGIDNDQDKARLVKGIIDMGHSLHMLVVTEGIETAGEAALVRELGSECGQGYLFARPMDPADVERVLQLPEGLTTVVPEPA